MSKSLKLLTLAGLIVAVSACARKEPAQEEFIIVDPEPISMEPAHTGKYK